ncbi:MAG: hypothetical protein JRJ69_08860 [Deltaproteobacteria bacterium]|nr:hypothetical protein [Deltaproteobacteria bacterium]MBW1737649.1 hypothetical protein [Deltaproteobacteria bacterium]MBW1908181.1 hypothetical protein [Deltaproteobacteria bacterium]MBW2032862.1 hypothetical protein [Deltaproteobacteria bacterium]MBW2114690.1 hypothetical protein [Deltaproteobacteria bacterium]
MRLIRLVFLIPAFVILTSYAAWASGYIQVAGLIDLRTTFSDGELHPEALVKLAKERGFEVLFINDHDRLAMEYGLFPLRNIFKKRVELNSINKGGAENFLRCINEVAEKVPEMIIIPGSETAPFYYWTGSYFKGNLTAHNHEKRILTIGLEKSEDYEDLPILHNGFSTRYVMIFLPQILLFLIPFVMGLFMLRWKGFSRIWGIVICGLSLVFFINGAPFRSSPFDQYHGDQGIVPHQLVIDYVDSKGGLTFWNYPETRSGVRKMGPIFVNTPPYPEVLQQAKGYTGFAALYGDTITVTEPGHQWDRVLLEYCRGERARPVWAISTADFHKDGGSGEKLGNFPTILLVKKKTKKEILFAMRQGRMYACRGKYPQRMVLNDFSVSSAGCKNKAVSGDEIALNDNPRVHVFLSLKEPTENRVKIRLIRSGELLEVFDGSLPIEIDYEDKYFKPGRKIYYRIDARGCGDLVSNPIFVTFR